MRVEADKRRRLSPSPVTATDFAIVGFASDWWARASLAHAAATQRACSDGTVGLEFVNLCRPTTYATRVTSITSPGDLGRALHDSAYPPRTSSVIVLTEILDSWLQEELKLDLSSALTALANIRLRDLAAPSTEPGSRTAKGESGQIHLEQAEQVRERLAVTWAQLEAITGISQQTFYDWKRKNRQARPSTLRKLRRVFSLVRALERQLGQREAAQWFQTGSPSPLEVMLEGRLDAVERQVGRMLPAAVSGASSLEAVDLEPEHVPVKRGKSSPRRAATRRSGRRSTLPSRD